MSLSKRPISSGSETSLLLLTVNISSETKLQIDAGKYDNRLQLRSSVLIHLRLFMLISGMIRMTFEERRSFSSGL